MKISNLLLGVLIASVAGAVKFGEEEEENATEGELSLLTTTSFFEADDGVTPEDDSDRLSAVEVIHSFELHGDDQSNRTAPPLLTLELPENHKNATNDPYASSIELPPVLKQFNAYQQQYKNYYRQKSEYDYKPVKFEADAVKNHYITKGLGSYLEDDAGHRYEELKYNREPFPYTYESERIPFVAQPVWSNHLEESPTQNEIGYNYNYYRPPKQEEHVSKDEDKSLHGWKKALKFFTTLVPLGLLLATFTPSVISINSTTYQRPAKQRSLDEGLHGLKAYLDRMNKAENPECEKRLICEVSRLGKDGAGSYVQKSFWFLANETPNDLAEHLGAKELFRRIREGECDRYKCQKKRKKPSGNGKGRKKLSRELKP